MNGFLKFRILDSRSETSADLLISLESESEVESSFNVISCALSSSDSEDNLMVSQELRPGFSSVNAEENCDEPTDSERHLDMAMDVLGGTITDFANKIE